MNENNSFEKKEDILAERKDLTREALIDNTLENPFEKITAIRAKFANRIDEPVEFGPNGSSLLYFSNDIGTEKEKWLEDFSRIIIFHGNNILPNYDNKVDKFWDTLRSYNGKTLGEMLNKVEELLSEIKNEE